MIGKDVFVADHQFRANHVDTEELISYHGEARGGTVSFMYIVSYFFGFWNAWNVMGMVMWDSGMVQTALLMALIFILIHMSCRIFTSSFIFGTGYVTMEDLASVALGKAGKIVVSIMVFIVYMAMSCDVTLVAPFVMSNVFEANIENCPSFLSSRLFIVYINYFLFVVPTMLLNSRSLTFLMAAYANVVFIVGLIAFCVAAVGHMDTSQEFVLFTWNLKDSMRPVSKMLMVLFTMPMFTIVKTAMERPTPRRINMAFTVMSILRVIAISVASLVGMLVRRPGVSAICSLDYLSATDPWAILARTAMIMSSTVSNTTIALMLASRLCTLVLPGSEESRVVLFTAGLAITTLTMIVTLIIDIEFARSIIMTVASVAACFCSLIVPPVISLGLFGLRDRVRAVKCIVVLTFGIILIPCIIYGTE